VKPSQERCYEQLDFRNALCSYFDAIIVHDQQMHWTNVPSASSRYINERFKPVFFEVCKLVNDIESHQLHVRRLAKLMDEFSKMLISSGDFTQKQLSAFWANGRHSNCEITMHSTRLKFMGARTLSAIVADAASSRRKPDRPCHRRPSANGPVFPRLRK
jgi:hypothetical protein